ncbi:hypothetical protein [Paenibacillus sp. UNC451MF]|uniref:hypothetical protein n=1 Tax=Paenibacillus sp. UNC451MF TaxID=1449063 RepID=UPI00048D52DF|nr:hypothetical protein [Paenibacillus sp. UNC451MF]
MNRRDFFKEIKESLTVTLKEIMTPFIERDVEKLNLVAETFSGIRFYPVSFPNEDAPFEEVLIRSEPIIVTRSHNVYLALSKKCPECGQLLHYLAYKGSFKCFVCEDREFTLTLPQSFVSFRTKVDRGRLYVGIPEKEESHA